MKQLIEIKLESQDNKHKVGWICLATDPVSEADARRYLPMDKYSLFVNRIPFPSEVTNENLKQMDGRISNTASLILPDESLDVLNYGCTSCVTNLGFDTVCELLTHDRNDSPVLPNPATSGHLALKALKVDSIGLVTPYIEEVAMSVADHFEDEGIDVPNVVWMDCIKDFEISRVPRQSIIDAAIKVSEGVDAVFLSCAAFRGVDCIEEIEQITGKPVVTSNQAMIWHTMRACDDNSTDGPGMLFNH
jgi:maleate isomerase